MKSFNVFLIHQPETHECLYCIFCLCLLSDSYTEMSKTTLSRGWDYSKPDLGSAGLISLSLSLFVSLFLFVFLVSASISLFSSFHICFSPFFLSQSLSLLLPASSYLSFLICMLPSLFFFPPPTLLLLFGIRACFLL